MQAAPAEPGDVSAADVNGQAAAAAGGDQVAAEDGAAALAPGASLDFDDDEYTDSLLEIHR